MALVLASIWALGLYLSHVMGESYVDNVSSQLANEARLVGNTASPLFGGDVAHIDALATELGGQIDARITIVALDGTVLGDSERDPSGMENHANRPEIVQALAQGVGTSIRHSDTLGLDMMYVAVPIEGGGETVGTARIALPLIQIGSSLAQIRGIIAAAAAIASVASIVLAFLIARVTTGPLQRLTQMSKRMAEGELGQTIQVSSRDEVAELAQALNHLSAQLRETLHQIGVERDMVAAIVDNMADGIIMTDSEGRVALMNPAAEAILDAHREAAQGRLLIEITGDPEADSLLRRCLEQGQPQATTVERSVPGHRYLSLTATPMEHGALLILRDLTELRRLEAVRRNFVSNISHELRTPLAAIKVLVETIQEELGQRSEVADGFLQRVDAEVNKMGQMVAELGELSRIESGEVAFDMRPSSASEIVYQASERMRPMAERSGLKLEVDIPPDLPPVLADRERIEQALTSLLHNAIKFTPRGGITVSASHSGSFVAISVSDTGIGIPADDLPRIFERFYKADKARAGGGTGLGLAIAKHIVQAHGGQIWAQSTEGRGSTFTFTIPVKNP